MDPLSIATGVAGLASLAVQVGTTLHGYIANVKHAQEDAAAYAAEVTGLVQVCQRLHVFLKTDAGDAFVGVECVLSRTVASCDGCLRELARMLDSQSLRHGGLARFKWPLYKKPVQSLVMQLGRYTQLFQFALTVEGW